jgi:hypothetical protein
MAHKDGPGHRDGFVKSESRGSSVLPGRDRRLKDAHSVRRDVPFKVVICCLPMLPVPFVGNQRIVQCLVRGARWQVFRKVTKVAIKINIILIDTAHPRKSVWI